MPKKHNPGGCNCCAPCGFGCDPCLGSVSLDAGVYGTSSWMYALPDPCTGILTLNDPFCGFGDCNIDCDVTADAVLCESLGAVECGDVSAICGIGGCYFTKSTYSNLRIKGNVRSIVAYSYHLFFSDSSTLTITATVAEWRTIRLMRSMTFNKYTGFISGSDCTACNGTPTWVLDSQNVCETDAGLSCPIAANEPFSYFPLRFGFNPCAGTTFSVNVDQVNPYYSTLCGYNPSRRALYSQAKSLVNYSKTVALGSCAGFFDTFTLDLVSDSGSTQRAAKIPYSSAVSAGCTGSGGCGGCWISGDSNYPCWLDDCCGEFDTTIPEPPATITVTLA